MADTRDWVRQLYFGGGRAARRFRAGLITFDLVVIVYFVLSSMLHVVNHWVDYGLAVVLAVDYTARLMADRHPVRFVFRFASMADVVVILSLVAAALFENLGFLRVVRMLRLLRSYHVLVQLRGTSPWFRRNEDVIQSAVNLLVFVFVITAIVYVLEVDRNPAIGNYLDALYFTVATLTTTGFGDITMQDSVGRFVAVLIMVFGVALFLRLVQTIFRPAKVNYPCPDCGLRRHDTDAVHCKHCGALLNIPTDGDWA